MKIHKQNQQLYFIAIVCPEPLQSEITAIKNYFFKKYNCKVALKSPAHITLIPPFELKHHNEQQLYDYLQQFKIKINTISIILSGYGHFEKRTIFFQPRTNEELDQLQLKLQVHMKQQLFHIKTQHHYNPHITVANRDIKPKEFEEAWEIFKEQKFDSSFECNHFALLKLTDKKWNVIAEFDWQE